MSTTKTSVALGKEELVAAKRAAKREGVSVSAFLTRLIREHAAQVARFEAMKHYLDAHAPDFRPTDAARAAVVAEWTAPLSPVRRRSRRRAA
jgi:hypothetical protein